MMRPLVLLAWLGVVAARVDTVEELKINKYAGRWYEVYADKVVLSTFEKDNVCVTADYKVTKAGTLAVHNAANLRTPKGKVVSINGQAVIPNVDRPGKLAVTLQGAPQGADYWVVALGPETYGEEDLYEWAIVTDRFQATLFVLARDPGEFFEKYDEIVQEKLQVLGFTESYNKPIKVEHEGCTYRGHASRGRNRPPRKRALPTVPELDIDAYVGRWYQVINNYIVQYSIELFGTCVTADYTLQEDGSTIDIINSENLFKPDGDRRDVLGYAYAKNASDPGKLSVKFYNLPGEGSYWIVKLGPKLEGSYAYAVVTDDSSTSLFVLARDVTDFRLKYQDEVLGFIWPRFQGFLRLPRDSYQSPECHYRNATYSEPFSPVYVRAEREKGMDREDMTFSPQQQGRLLRGH